MKKGYKISKTPITQSAQKTNQLEDLGGRILVNRPMVHIWSRKPRANTGCRYRVMDKKTEKPSVVCVLNHDHMQNFVLKNNAHEMI